MISPPGGSSKTEPMQVSSKRFVFLLTGEMHLHTVRAGQCPGVSGAQTTMKGVTNTQQNSFPLPLVV